MFNGHMDKTYHMFRYITLSLYIYISFNVFFGFIMHHRTHFLHSDPYVSINARFTDANPYNTYGGTVMKVISVTYLGTTIVVNRVS